MKELSLREQIVPEGRICMNTDSIEALKGFWKDIVLTRVVKPPSNFKDYMGKQTTPVGVGAYGKAMFSPEKEVDTLLPAAY